MPREKELYRDTLESFRKRADEKYPDKLIFTQKEAAVLLGVSISTLHRRGLSSLITVEQLARAFS